MKRMPNNNDNAALNWLKVAWPVMAFTIVMAIGGLKAFSSQQQQIAIIETKAENYEEDMKEVKSELKEIKAILMNPVR